MSLGRQDLAKIITKKTSITAAQFRACGTTPIPVTPFVSQSGIINPVSALLVPKRGPGAVNFAFSGALVLHSSGYHRLLGGLAIDQAVFINLLATVYDNVKFVPYSNTPAAYPNIPTSKGSRWELTTLDAADSAVGDTDVDIIIHYTIDPVKL